MSVVVVKKNKINRIVMCYLVSIIIIIIIISNKITHRRYRIIKTTVQY